MFSINFFENSRILGKKKHVKFSSNIDHSRALFRSIPMVGGSVRVRSLGRSLGFHIMITVMLDLLYKTKCLYKTPLLGTLLPGFNLSQLFNHLLLTLATVALTIDHL
jgi:hypothetical protein